MGYSHGIRWTDDLIKEQILEVKQALELDRMPSRQECSTYYQNGSLASIISRKGWYKLAAELGLPIKSSETQLGKTFELEATAMLQSKGFDVKRMSQNYPYDLLVNDCIKVDVKASRLYKGKTGDFYSFGLAKPFATCDVYILITLNDACKADRFMVVPSKFVHTNKQISVGAVNSKYHKFTDRWDYIKTISDFWQKVVN